MVSSMRTGTERPGVSREMRYEEIVPIAQSEAEAALHRGAAGELRLVVISVSLYEDELHWAQDFCIGLASHTDPYVRGNAVLGLGHLARRFGTLSPAAAPIVAAALRDPDEFVRGQAHAAADDLDHFLGLRLAQ